NKVYSTRFFYKKAKRLLKKYASLENNLKHLEQALLKNPKIGISYGGNIYKIRLADEAKGRGKSGGFRVVTYLIEETDQSTTVFLITIFDKSEEASISKTDIKK